MRPEGLIPSLLVYGVIPSLPVINKTLTDQKERIAAVALAHSKMATVHAELRISRAIRSKLPPATHFHYESRDLVRV